MFCVQKNETTESKQQYDLLLLFFFYMENLNCSATLLSVVHCHCIAILRYIIAVSTICANQVRDAMDFGLCSIAIQIYINSRFFLPFLLLDRSANRDKNRWHTIENHLTCAKFNKNSHHGALQVFFSCNIVLHTMINDSSLNQFY